MGGGAPAAARSRLRSTASAPKLCLGTEAPPRRRRTASGPRPGDVLESNDQTMQEEHS